MATKVTKKAGERIVNPDGSVQITPSQKITETPQQTMTQSVWQDNPNFVPPPLSAGGFDPNAQVGMTKDPFGDVVMSGNLPPQIPNQQPQQTQQQTNQPQQNKGFVEKAATIGVTPAVFAANLISRGVKLFTGQDLGQITPEQFAGTDIGKIIGIGTDLAGIGVGIAGGFALAGAGAKALPIISQEARLLQARFAVPKLIGSVVSKNTLATKLISSNFLKIGALGIGIGTPLKLTTDAKKAIVSSGESISLVLDAFKNNFISYEDASNQLDEIKSQINSTERSLNLWNKVSVIHYLGGGKDTAIDVLNAKQKLINAKSVLGNILIQKMRGLA